MSITGTVATSQSSQPEGYAPIRNESIMASAGSGKTYALSSRYLRLILMGAPPASILASTFTRAAAGEIRDRILERLAEAAIDGTKRNELSAAIQHDVLNQEEVLNGLSHLIHNLHRLHVRTLDSFFAQVVRCFSLELGVDPAARIVDADLDVEMRREAIEMMLDERDPQPLIDLLRVLTEGSAERRVMQTIDAQMSELYELYREAQPEAWETIRPWKPLDQSALEAAIRALESAEPGTNGHHINAHRRACELARNCRPQHTDDWVSFLKGGLPAAILTKGGIFHRKAIEDDVVTAIEPILDHAKAVLRNSIIARTRSTHALLERFHQRYEEAKSKHKAMTFADITSKVASAMSGNEERTADEICFRLDATMRHILLDEMQDTSVQQWRALREIVRSIISEPPPDRSFFCVGDVKQSIYGWREACPEILAQMPALIEQLGGRAEPGEPLVRNWRSSPVVLEAVDRVFTEVRQNPALEGSEDAAATWDEAYLPHEAQHKEKPGFVELHIAPRAGEDDEKQSIHRLQYAADLIARLYHDAPGRRIGVLTRTNKSVHRLLYELGPVRHLDVAGQGGGALTDSASVNAMLDLLRLADHPAHTIAAFNVIHSPLGLALGFQDFNQCKQIARNVRCRLLDDGYAKTIGKWIAMIGEQTDDRQVRRLIQLQQLAAQFDSRATLRTDDFLSLVEATTVSDVGAARVQVMTVHQSKGLEFDIVVLPELDNEIAQTSKLKMIVERDDLGNILRVARHVKQHVWDLFDDIQPMFAQHKRRIARESLCVLYVAMTRARSALHMVIDPPRENENTFPKKLSGILRHALAPGVQCDPETIIYQSGDPNWHQFDLVEGEDDGQHVVSPGDAAIELVPATGNIPRGRTSPSASSLGKLEGAEEDAADFTFRVPNRDARERGTAIHRMFETIEWIDDYVSDRDALMRIALEVAPRRSAEWAQTQVDAFLGAIEQPEVRHALSRSQTQGAAHLWREVPFAHLVSSEIRSGIIDRLVATFDQSGQCTKAAVLDYKSDRVDPDAVAERAEHHRPQLEAYRAAAAAMLGLDEAAVTMHVLFTDRGVMITLP